jgi:hypothetical protein
MTGSSLAGFSVSGFIQVSVLFTAPASNGIWLVRRCRTLVTPNSGVGGEGADGNTSCADPPDTLPVRKSDISLGPQVIQLRPALHCRTPILSYSLDVTPSEHILNWQLDPHNNRLARLLFSGKTNEFLVEVNLVADLSPYNPFAFFLEPGFEEYPFAYAPGLAKDLEPYRSVDPPGPLLHAFLESFVGRKSGTIGLLLDLNRKVRDEIGYVTRLEPGVQTCEETLEKRSGSCRDSAWLLVQSLRNLGIAARFVSGYLIQLQSPIRRRKVRKRIQRICTPGQKRSCRARAGLEWIRPRACLPARVTSRLSALRLHRKPRQSEALRSRPKWSLATQWRFAV